MTLGDSFGYPLLRGCCLNMTDQLPESLGETYTKVRILHEGRNSIVYLVKHDRLHNLWAIKQVFKGSAAEEGARREFALLRSLRHPKLPFVSGIAEDENSVYLIEEYIEGKTLEEELADGKRMTGREMEERAISLGIELCDILSYLHGQDPPVLHRDLKPANIMLLPDGGIKLLDFGISARSSQQEQSAAGTPGYAAPEQLTTGKADVRADIYSLGVTLFETASGKSRAATPYALPHLRTVNPDASYGLEHIILRCTQTDPAMRYGSVAEVLHDLRNTDDLRPEKNTDRREEQRKITPVIVILAAAIVCAFIGTLVFTGVRGGLEAGVPGSNTTGSGQEEQGKNDSGSGQEASDTDGSGNSLSPADNGGASGASDADSSDSLQDSRAMSAYEEGVYLLAQGDPLEAIEKLTEALPEDPENADIFVRRGDAGLMAAEQTMTSHTLVEDDLIQRGRYYRSAQEDYEKALELGSTEAESRLSVLSSLLEGAAIDEEVLQAMQGIAESFSRDEIGQACSLIASSDAARTSYCNIHRVQSILYPTDDGAVLSGWPWTYFGAVESELPSGEGIAVNQERMMRVVLRSDWVEGIAVGEAAEETENLTPMSAGGSFFITRRRVGQMNDGVMEGGVVETLTYKISEEDGDGRIMDLVTDPFEITYTLKGGVPEAMDKSILPADIEWRNGARLETEKIYAFSEEARLLFYVDDYQSYTYKMRTP